MIQILSNPYGTYTLARREISRFLKVYFQTLLAPLLNNLLFLAVFGASLSGREVGISGVSYLPFLVPGLCVIGSINSAFQNPSSSLVIQKYQNLIQDINSFPITIAEKILAYTAAGTIRGVLVGIMTYLASIPFVGWHIEHPLLFVVILTLVSFIASAFGLCMGLISKTFDQLAFVSNFILTPLIFFGGVFFSLSKLPGVLAKISMLNPIFPLVDTLRFAFIGIHEGNLLVHSLLMGGYVIISLCICAYLFKKGVGLTT